ncbi:MAG: hypothetical protein WEA77_01435 [Hyphomonas sp.]|uniref:hypothetical protein n=1 Tax=Hyphomonas sp. TaxID=87 RepID=UPI00349FF03A
MIRRAVQILLAAFFLIAGILHFRLDDAFARIVPPMLPFPIAIVWITGLTELVFAAALIARWRLPLTGLLLSAYLLAVLPANIYMAIAQISLGDTALSPAALWVRVALQFPLIALVLWCAGAPPLRKAQDTDG